jgi:toxin secretion/phage lysis holin
MQIKILLAIVGGYMSYALGGWDAMLKTLVYLTLADYITGVLVAIYQRKLSSSIGYKGIIKKVMMFGIVAVANCVDMAVGAEIVRNITIVFYISNEGISILENADKMGVPIPEKLRQVLKQFKEDKK